MCSKVRSDFLFAQPSWLSGVARVLNLWGCFDSYDQLLNNPTEIDLRATYADWAAVEEDLKSVYKNR
jgi:hypothetical protein